MTGKELKEILDTLGVRYNDLAVKLGTSQQNFSASLKVNDIKTGYIERIARAIHVPVVYFYDRAARMGTTITSEEEDPEPQPEPEPTEKAPETSDTSQVLMHLTALIVEQNQKLDNLSRAVADLNTILRAASNCSQQQNEAENK